MTLTVVFPRMSDVMADEDDVFMAAAAISVATAAISAVIVTRRRKKRTMYVRPMFRMRQQYGAYDLLLAELRSSDKAKYRGFVRFIPAAR